MPRATHTQTSFVTGEVSPRLFGRTDLSRYQSGLEKASNCIAYPHGMMSRRPGTKFVAHIKDNGTARLMPFKFNDEQAYIVELGDEYARFYRDGAQIREMRYDITDAIYSSGEIEYETTNDHNLGVGDYTEITGVSDSGASENFNISGYVTEVPTSKTFKLAAPDPVETYISSGDYTAPYQIDAPWDSADVDGVGIVQSGDVLYAYHKRYHPRKIQRTGSDAFEIVGKEMLDGPFEELQASADWELENSDTQPYTSTRYQDAMLLYKLRSNDDDFAGYRRGEIFRITQTSGVDEFHSTSTSAAFSKRVGQIFKFRNDTSKGYVIAQIIGANEDSLAFAVVIKNGANADGTDWNFTNATSGNNLIESSSSPDTDSIFWGEFYGAIINTAHAKKSVTNVTNSAGNYLEITCLEKHCIKQSDPTSETVTLSGFFSGGGPDGSINGTYSVLSVVSDTVFRVSFTATASATTMAVSDSSAATFEPFLFSTLNEGLEKCNFPSLGEFFQQRLWIANSPDSPNKMWASVTGDFQNYQPLGTGPSDIVQDDDAVKVEIDESGFNEILWMESAARGIVVGTAGIEASVSGGTTSEVITPSNIRSFKQTSHGSKDGRNSIRSGRSILFAHRSSRKLIELLYSFEADQQVSSDISIVSEHVLEGLVKEIHYQEAPIRIVWIVLEDGTFTCLTFEKDQEVIGWTTGSIGGSALVESMSIIPETNEDAVWMITNRSGTRSVEFLQEPQEIGDDQLDAWFVDCALKYDERNTVSTQTLSFEADSIYDDGDTGTLTAAGYTPFSASSVGDFYRLYDSNGVGYDLEVTGFTSSSEVDATIRTSGFPAELEDTATSNTALLASTFSGLEHLEGLELGVYADGQSIAKKTVSSGSISLGARYAVVIAGIDYTSQMKSLPIRVIQYFTDARGKFKALYNCSVSVWNSLGGTASFGESIYPISYDTRDDISGKAPLLKSQEVDVLADNAYDPRQSLDIVVSDPVPFNLLAVTYEFDINDTI